MYAQLIDVGVEDAIDEANARTLVGVLVWKLDMNLPQPALEWRVFWSLESDIELLPTRRSASTTI
jgi:hypothetical protein